MVTEEDKLATDQSTPSAIVPTALGRVRAAQLAEGFPATQDVILQGVKAVGHIVRILKMEYRTVHPKSREVEIDRFVTRILIALQARN
jgi:hypothetical protein